MLEIYLLPIFKASGRTNYSIEAVTMLSQYQFNLTPRQAAELKWNRFINVHEIAGRNIPCDLHIEHLNRTCKDTICGLHANKTPTAITRIGKSLGAFYNTLEQYDKDNGVKNPSGIHHKPSVAKERDMIVMELLLASVFKKQSARKHSSYPHVKMLLHSVSKTSLIDWMVMQPYVMWTNDYWHEHTIID